jgi:hypothetical protein
MHIVLITSPFIVHDLNYVHSRHSSGRPEETKNIHSVLSVCCLVVKRQDNTQTGKPDTHTNRGHTATNPKKTNDEAGG